MKKKPSQSVIRVLGMMTGTSCDGLDGSILEFSPDGHFHVIAQKSFSYPSQLKRRVLEIQEPGVKISLKNFLELHRDLGIWYAKCARAFDKHSVDLISNHGQTIAHHPELKPLGVTLQLGDMHVISEYTKKTVTSLFRNGDMASDGQGAPLVPRFHHALAKNIFSDVKGTAIHNLGGISNFTYFKDNKTILAFDTGPGNVWIDFAAQAATQNKLPYDKNGSLAKQGHADLKLVKSILKTHPYFSKKPPKSTGRDDFSKTLFSRYFKGKPDDVATSTLLTAESISHAYKAWVVDKKLGIQSILFCGGGAKNPTLMDWTKEAILRVSPKTKISILEDSQFIEAQAFSYFGYETLLGHGLGGAWTGGSADAPPGALVPGKNWNALIEKLKDHSSK